MAADPAQTSPAVEQRVRWRSRQSPQLTSMSEAARKLLRAGSATRPMISRAGISTEARHVRSIMRATMKDQITGGR